MARNPRASVGGICYHVLNRGNNRQRVFRKEGDYAAFLKAMGHACVEVSMRVLAYCLMPNHFHLAVWPEKDGDLSLWMHWLLNTHVRRYHKHHQSSGHIWQGRFKALPVEQDGHLLTMLRYVERNAARAKLAKLAEDWQWSSARYWTEGEQRPGYLVAGPVLRPKKWLEWVNEPLTEAELEAVRDCVNRDSPYGSDVWKKSAAERLGLQSTLRPRGRPRKSETDARSETSGQK